MNNNTNPKLNHVVNQAKEELVGLMKHKGEVTKRIGTIKLTLAGLANLFGNQLPRETVLKFRESTGKFPAPASGVSGSLELSIECDQV